MRKESKGERKERKKGKQKKEGREEHTHTYTKSQFLHTKSYVF
jgi:hypothetical protein